MYFVTARAVYFIRGLPPVLGILAHRELRPAVAGGVLGGGYSEPTRVTRWTVCQNSRSVVSSLILNTAVRREREAPCLCEVLSRI